MQAVGLAWDVQPVPARIYAEARLQSRSESRRAIMGRASRDSRPGRRGYDSLPEHHRVRECPGSRSVSA